MFPLSFRSGIDFLFFIVINQPLAQDMRDIYNLSPSAGGGIYFALAPNRSFRTNLEIMYDKGEVRDYWGHKSSSHLMALFLETGFEIGATPYEHRGPYLGGGTLLGIGSESVPTADTLGNITQQGHSGAALGVVFFMGAHLIPWGKWSFGFESKIRLLSIPVQDYELNLSGLSIGLTLRRWP
jgi:hypothetical protein